MEFSFAEKTEINKEIKNSINVNSEEFYEELEYDEEFTSV